MLSDWYRALEIGMGLGEWERLPRHAGFRYEYVGGRAVIVPRAVQRDAVLELGRVAAGEALEGVRVMEEGDWGKLPEVMDWAFAGVGSFSTMEDAERLLAVREALETTRGGGDGVVVGEACHVACGEAGEIVGAALVTIRAERDVPLLTWIFVSPLYRRRRVGRGLLVAVAGVLRRRGYVRVESVFEVGNVGSMMWHWGMGFELMTGEGE